MIKSQSLAIVVGAGHTGIEKVLGKEDKERVRLIDRLLNVPGLGKAREKIATIARCDFDKNQNKWLVTEIFEDPYLAPLEKK